MATSWIIIAGFSIVAIVLIVYLVRQNREDGRRYEEFLNKQGSVEADIEEDEPNNEK
ncbi:hypothetical protein [Flavobacterium sp.]|uniref:hypothetical protein n=1 Tax=Flavobacterium sp. TaxID=239 RepID=UPI0025BEE8D8|nr:hypothetical protein [Flavobacterium sp.]